MAISEKLGIVSLGDLVSRLGSAFPIETLKQVADSRDEYYRKKEILKENGSARELLVSVGPLRKIQRRIYWRLLKNIEHEPWLHGGVPGRSVLTNAIPHVGKEVIVKFDFMDFFPSIDEQRVINIWQRRLGCGKKVSRLLTRLTTHENQLPQGVSTSPALANFALFDAEGELLKQLSHHGIENIPTRFVDDLTFSGPSGDEQELIATVMGVMRAYGFTLNRKKTKIRRRGQPQRVCKIGVNSDHLSIGKSYVKNLRAAIFQLEQASPEEKQDRISSLEGKARRVIQFRPEIGKKLLERIIAIRQQFKS